MGKTVQANVKNDPSKLDIFYIQGIP